MCCQFQVFPGRGVIAAATSHTPLLLGLGVPLTLHLKPSATTPPSQLLSDFPWKRSTHFNGFVPSTSIQGEPPQDMERGGMKLPMTSPCWRTCAQRMCPSTEPVSGEGGRGTYSDLDLSLTTSAKEPCEKDSALISDNTHLWICSQERFPKSKHMTFFHSRSRQAKSLPLRTNSVETGNQLISLIPQDRYWFSFHGRETQVFAGGKNEMKRNRLYLNYNKRRVSIVARTVVFFHFIMKYISLISAYWTNKRTFYSPNQCRNRCTKQVTKYLTCNGHNKEVKELCLSRNFKSSLEAHF